MCRGTYAVLEPAQTMQISSVWGELVKTLLCAMHYNNRQYIWILCLEIYVITTHQINVQYIVMAYFIRKCHQNGFFNHFMDNRFVCKVYFIKLGAVFTSISLPQQAMPISEWKCVLPYISFISILLSQTNVIIPFCKVFYVDVLSSNHDRWQSQFLKSLRHITFYSKTQHR